MEYAEFAKRLKIGDVVGRGARSYEVERITPENTYLRGNPGSRRQDSGDDRGSLRIIPTQVLLSIISAIEGQAIGIDDITRDRSRGGSQSSSIFNRLGLDFDPYLLGYDSTIRSISEHVFSDSQLHRPTKAESVAFLPKPFLLLAGISGTGKTRWVRQRELAGEDNVEVIAVRPDWHEPADLLGYLSRISAPPVFVPTDFLRFLLRAWRRAWAADPRLGTRAMKLREVSPFWLCLDEMNLAPVEQYFADYLSVLEERTWAEGEYHCPPLLRFNGEGEAIRQALGVEAGDPLWAAFGAARVPGIPLPPNLVVVGTVNMDETTHAFSRKVLDRALTVEFDEVDFRVFRGPGEGDEGEATLPWIGLSTVTDARDLDNLAEDRIEAVTCLLEAWNRILDQTAFRIAYRTINEGLLIAASLADRPLAEALDWIAMAKLLPRLEGDEYKLGSDRDGEEGSYLDSIAQDWSGRFGEAWEASRSRRKLEFMQQRLKRSGYSSYWP